MKMGYRRSRVCIAPWLHPRALACLSVTPFDLQLRSRVIFGEGTFSRLGELARALSFSRTLIVADQGVVDLGHVERAAEVLERAGIRAFRFHDFGPNPDTNMVEAGRVFAAASGVDSVVAIGGGSSLDCAKGINFVLTNGGSMRDYRGHEKATRPMLPLIGVPTTAGTGSEAQSLRDHLRCGDARENGVRRLRRRCFGSRSSIRC